MAAIAPISIDAGLSGADKIKSLFNQKGIKVADADSVANGGNGDGLVTKDELSRLTLGNVSALELDSFGGMDSLKAALSDYDGQINLTDTKAYDTHADNAKVSGTDSPAAGANSETDALKKQIQDLQDQLKKLQDQQGNKPDDGEGHHRHHHHHHHRHESAGFNPFDPIGLLRA